MFQPGAFPVPPKAPAAAPYRGQLPQHVVSAQSAPVTQAPSGCTGGTAPAQLLFPLSPAAKKVLSGESRGASAPSSELSMPSSMPAATEPEKVESHQKAEVSGHLAALRAVGPATRSEIGSVRGAVVPDQADPPAGHKLVYFIRHGEGYHNAIQREWRADPGWDGKSEPYTVDNDPEFRYIDALLTPTGQGQAEGLQARTATLQPELLVVSPLRRATQTGLLAFNAQLGSLPVIANELCHETGGRHTCDKRLPRSELAQLYPVVDYSLITEEEDPLWGDGVTREETAAVAARAAAFLRWLAGRSERRLAVAAHSAFLLSMFNAALVVEGEEDRGWFGTGEMRATMLDFTQSNLDVA